MSQSLAETWKVPSWRKAARTQGTNKKFVPWVQIFINLLQMRNAVGGNLFTLKWTCSILEGNFLNCSSGKQICKPNSLWFFRAQHSSWNMVVSHQEWWGTHVFQQEPQASLGNRSPGFRKPKQRNAALVAWGEHFEVSNRRDYPLRGRRWERGNNELCLRRPAGQVFLSPSQIYIISS